MPDHTTGYNQMETPVMTLAELWLSNHTVHQVNGTTEWTLEYVVKVMRLGLTRGTAARNVHNKLPLHVGKVFNVLTTEQYKGAGL